MDRVIPPFYACYLLRSTVRHQNIYVGSTPNPVRRLKQHNGFVKGGAVRTARDTLRPWEMTCLVTGFPSKIAALQFEWAWQNTHLTRHITVGERITHAVLSGKTRKRVRRPRFSLTDKLANLHILLRSKSFERWPLEVKFFAGDVFKIWEREKAKRIEEIRSGIKIGLDPSVATSSGNEDQSLTGIHTLDVTFQPMKSTLESTRKLLEGPANICAVCKDRIEPNKSMALVCSAGGCQSTSHLSCLSGHFLAEERQATAILPTGGKCPTCGTELRWRDLVQDLSLRIRGEKEVAELFKERKRRKKVGAIEPTNSMVMDEDASEDDLIAEESDIDLEHPDLVVPSEFHNMDKLQQTQGIDRWQDVDDIVGDLSPPPKITRRKVSKRAAAKASDGPRHEIVIEDSEWDEADLVE